MFALIGVLVFSEIYSYTSYEVVYEYSVDQDTSSWVTPELSQSCVMMRIQWKSLRIVTLWSMLSRQSFDC